ncbi:MAG TPA: HEAT repeat domain-containing protein [Polyangiaceae bacterium]
MLGRACILSLLVAGCASSPAMRAAESGDQATLGSVLAAREKRGEVSNDEAANLAHAVADRDLRAGGATPEQTLALVRDARPCARELDSALAVRMRVHDEAGALAALARIEGQGLDLDDARDFAADPDGAWRAVGARGLVRSEDRDTRLRALVDPDPRVRRQAAVAARDDADPNDLSVLAEAVRVDPDPMVRTEAVRAIAVLEPLPEGEVADVLRDLWPDADEGLREDIAIAWASPRVWDSGGSEALRVLAASGHGAGVVEGAAAVLRTANLGGDVVISAIAQMERAIEEGSRSRRMQAIAEAPLGRPELRAALAAAADGEDLEVRVAALARLAQAKQPDAIPKLEALASPGSPVAVRARFALAELGDRRIQAWIEQDLASQDADDRLSAVTSLAALGVAGRGAPVLADGDAHVRVRAACTILMAARRD